MPYKKINKNITTLLLYLMMCKKDMATEIKCCHHSYITRPNLTWLQGRTRSVGKTGFVNNLIPLSIDNLGGEKELFLRIFFYVLETI